MIFVRILLIIVFIYYAGVLLLSIAADKTDAAMSAFLLAMFWGLMIHITRPKAL
jgi:hypothetical protein